jgi:glycosyltransferase involved in cell wall biosynthesis
LDRCEALVIPSTVESFGTVAIEAMARQRVVIASEHCGINAWPSLAAGLEVIRNGESLGATLQRYAAGPASEREAKARRAREAVERFVDETMRQWAEILEEGRRKRAGAT